MSILCDISWLNCFGPPGKTNTLSLLRLLVSSSLDNHMIRVDAGVDSNISETWLTLSSKTKSGFMVAITFFLYFESYSTSRLGVILTLLEGIHGKCCLAQSLVTTLSLLFLK